MSRSNLCPECSADLSTASHGGLCPACVIESIVDSEPQTDSLAAGGADPDSLIPFTIGDRIAKGGMGAILEADDRKLGRKIAVKVMLNPDADFEMRRRFVLEAAVLARLAHPNIVPVYDLGRDNDGQLFYSMKLVKGRTLQHIINELREENQSATAWYTLDRRLNVFRKICDAIAFAHSKGIIHRDLKPENIMVGEFGEVLVMDWGLSRIVSGDPESMPTGIEPPRGDSPGITLDGEIMGSPYYISPEQARGEFATMDQRTDIYALGGILYSLLTLRPPLSGSSVPALIDKAQQGDWIGFTEAEKSKLPSALVAVTEKALSFAPDDRYPTADALGEEVSKWQGGFATRAEGANLFTQIALLIRRNRALFRTAGIALLILLAFTGWFVVSLKIKERRAVAGETRALEAERVATKKQAETEAAHAKSTILLAEAARGKADPHLAKHLLESVPPAYRDSDWRYLRQRSRTSAFLSSDQYTSIAANPVRPGVFYYARKTGHIYSKDIRNSRETYFIKVPFKNPMLAVSPDGTLLAVGSTTDPKPGIRLYEIPGARFIRKWQAGLCHTLKFNRDQSLLLQKTTHREAKLNLWEVATGTLRWSKKSRLEGHFLDNPDQMLITGYDTSKVSIHSMADGSEIRTLFRRGLHHSVLSRDAKQLIGYLQDGFIAGYDVRGEHAFLKRNQASWGKCTFGSDSSRFYSATRVRDRRLEVQIVDGLTGGNLRKYPCHLTATDHILISVHPLSDDVFVGAEGAEAWVAPPKPKWTIPSTGRNRWTNEFWGSDDHFVCNTSGANYQCFFLDEEGNALLLEDISKGLKTHKLVIDPNSNTAVAWVTYQPQKPTDILRRAESKAEPFQTINQRGNILADSPVFSKESNLLIGKLLGNGASGTVVDLNTGEHIRRLALNQSRDSLIYDFTVLEGEKTVIGIGVITEDLNREYVIVKWNIETGRIETQQAHPSTLSAVCRSPDSQEIAEAGGDRYIRIRDAETLEVKRTFRAHDDEIQHLEWHPHQQCLASASIDGSVRIWHAETGEILATLDNFTGKIEKISFSPGGTRFAVTDGESTQIWNLRSPDELSNPDSGPLKNVRYVRIELDSGDLPLQIAEVEVFSGEDNIAPSGAATQSDTYENYPASLAIDHSKSPKLEDGGIAHTIPSTQPRWWELDLQRNTSVDRVKIWNRDDDLGWRLNGFSISLLNEEREIIFQATDLLAPESALSFDFHRSGKRDYFDRDGNLVTGNRINQIVGDG